MVLPHLDVPALDEETDDLGMRLDQAGDMRIGKSLHNSSALPGLPDSHGDLVGVTEDAYFSKATGAAGGATGVVMSMVPLKTASHSRDSGGSPFS